MVGTWVGTIRFVIALQKRAAMLGTRSAAPIVARGHEPHRKGRIHDRSRPVARASKNPLRNGGRPYMTVPSERDGLEHIKIAAHKRDVSYQSLIKMWLADKVR
jgi:hypothetical protein